MSYTCPYELNTNYRHCLKLRDEIYFPIRVRLFDKNGHHKNISLMQGQFSFYYSKGSRKISHGDD